MKYLKRKVSHSMDGRFRAKLYSGLKRGWLSAFPISILVCCLESSCKTVKPTSDATPPAISWAIFDRVSGRRAEQAGSGAITLKFEDHLQDLEITCIAEDPQGVHKISFGGEGDIVCSKIRPDLLEETLPVRKVFLKADEQTLSPDGSGKVLTQTLLVKKFSNLRDSACPGGFEIKKGTLTLTGTAENYFKGITTATLKVTK